ncbi:MAG: hypothetical protein H0X30_21965 [Anaerolineae bacterium]|nr:hypothetical protein [Anaerolineae bacterium]
MTSVEDLITRLLTGYSLEVEALLTWFPITPAADIREPRMKGISTTYSTSDSVFKVGNAAGLFLDQLATNDAVSAIFEFFVNQDGFFEVTIEVQMAQGAPTRKKHTPEARNSNTVYDQFNCCRT